MNLGHIRHRRHQSGANGPDRLVGDHRIAGIGPVGKRARQFRTNDGHGLAAIALFPGFADTDDGGEATGMSGGGLGLDLVAGFTVIGAPFGMTDDHMGTARIL